MSQLLFPGDSYHTPEGVGSGMGAVLPTPVFFWKVLNIIRREGHLAASRPYTGEDWSLSSLAVLRALESCGVRVHVTGMRHIDEPRGPCVFIANHMSTLETFVLPCLVQPRRETTFVVKDALLSYPWFKHVLRSRDPIAVSRSNPRQDLTAVLSGGEERLGRGRSVIVFPQSTRSTRFDPVQFNSIGIKLARRAGVPVVPVALRTDAWGVGALIKDLGRIRPGIPVRFAFGQPFAVTGNGKAEHARVCAFIADHLREWGLPPTQEDPRPSR